MALLRGGDVHPRPGGPGVHPHHDYQRNGTTTLFTALNVLDGTVVRRCMQGHRDQELLHFLIAVERRTGWASATRAGLRTAGRW